ncbi:MAG TPA: type III-A CRISPR-associated protein Csm2, partial [Thermodesulfovibrionia bacterium]|nr:type III-A CRISPR-associated protein Csm2 [Thermodesulfovibrionia bacterium]
YSPSHQDRDREMGRDRDRNKEAALTSAQLRRFYGEFKQLQKKVDTKGYEKVEPLIKMVKSKAYYSANPSSKKIPNAFRDFLKDNIDKIKDKQDFHAFMLHFEAVVGFFYGLGVKNN